MKSKNKNLTRFTSRALAVLALVVLSVAVLDGAVCSLPVVSTVELEYPLGTPKTTAVLTSSPSDLPTVYTGLEDAASQSMGSIFVALNLSGTFNGKPIKSVLNGDFPQQGKVQNVRHSSSGKFAGGHHILHVYQVYTVGSVSFFNKQPIVLAADIDSETPSGRTYTKQGGAVVSLYDKADPSKVIAKLYALSNKVQ